MSKTLTTDQENDLAWFFAGGLAVDAGHRSTMGSILDRMQYDLPSGGGGVGPEERGEWLLGRVRLERIIRERLSMLSHEQVAILRVLSSPIPDDRVWGLIEAFGGKEAGREAAAVAAMLAEAASAARRGALQASRSALHRGEPARAIEPHDAPGASQLPILRELSRRAATSEAKRAELAALRTEAKGKIADARKAYVEAIKPVRAADRAATDRRWSANVVPFARRRSDAA
jgi:hypothetical protein